jgi:hypothetical protein
MLAENLVSGGRIELTCRFVRCACMDLTKKIQKWANILTETNNWFRTTFVTAKCSPSEQPSSKVFFLLNSIYLLAIETYF